MSQPTQTTAPRRSLWSSRDFMLFWSGETISLMGTRITLVALPSVAILVLGAGTTVTGTLIALEWLPFLLLSSVAGVWADRMRRRPLMVFTAFGSAAVLASIPLAHVFAQVTLVHLYAAALALGVFGAIYQVTFRAYLPSLVEREEYIDANAKLQISHSVAHVGGPPLAGVLIGAFGATRTIIADAVSFVVAGITVLLIRKPEPAPDKAEHAGRSVAREVAQGGRFIWASAVLRNLVIMGTLGNLAISMGNAVLLVYIYRDLGIRPELAGVALGAGGVGLILGAMFSRVILDRLGIGPSLLLCAVFLGTGYLVLPLATAGMAVAIVAAGLFLAGLQAAPVNVGIMTLVQATTPVHLMGRVTGVALTAVWGANAAGGLLGGLLGGWIGTAGALAVCGVVALASMLFVIASPIIKIRRDLPGQQPAGGPDQDTTASGAGDTPDPGAEHTVAADTDTDTRAGSKTAAAPRSTVG